MIMTIVTLPVRVVQTIGALPGRLEEIERSMKDMQRLLGVAVERLDVIEGHTAGMHRQLGSIDESTNDLNSHTQGLGENTARLVRIASPFERGVGRGLFTRRRPENGTVEPGTE